MTALDPGGDSVFTRYFAGPDPNLVDMEDIALVHAYAQVAAKRLTQS